MNYGSTWICSQTDPIGSQIRRFSMILLPHGIVEAMVSECPTTAEEVQLKMSRPVDPGQGRFVGSSEVPHSPGAGRVLISTNLPKSKKILNCLWGLLFLVPCGRIGL